MIKKLLVVMVCSFMLSCVSTQHVVYSVNIAVDSGDPLIVERLIDLQDGSGQHRLRDPKPEVSAPFFGMDSGLYWAETANTQLDQNYRSRAFIVYVDSFGQALTVLEISSQELYPGLKIKNICGLDVVFTEDIRRNYDRLYNDIKNPINMTAELVDGGILFLDQVRHSNMTTKYRGMFDDNDLVLDWECYFPAFYAGLYRDIKSIRIHELGFKFINGAQNNRLSKTHYLKQSFAIEVFPSYLPASIESSIPEISYPQPEISKWIEDTGCAYITFDGTTITAVSRINGEKKDLISVVTEYSKNDEGLLVVTFKFSNLIGNGQLKYFRFTPLFFTSSNLYNANIKYAELDLRNEKTLTYTFEEAFKADRYDFEFANISLMFRSGNVIKSLIPVGDIRNPFTLLKQDARASSNWMSDPFISYLYWDDGYVIAYNTNSGEKVRLLKVDEEWLQSGNLKSNGNYILRFKDLSFGHVLGGSYFCVFNSVDNKPHRSVVSFRFDDEDVDVWGYAYTRGNNPYALVSLDNFDSDAGVYYRMMTVSFKDGNCKQVFIPLKKPIWFR